MPAPAAGGNLRALRQQMQLQGGTLRKGGAGAGAGGTMNGRATMGAAVNAASGMTIGQARAGLSGPGLMQSINYPKISMIAMKLRFSLEINILVDYIYLIIFCTVLVFRPRAALRPRSRAPSSLPIRFSCGRPASIRFALAAAAVGREETSQKWRITNRPESIFL